MKQIFSNYCDITQSCSSCEKCWNNNKNYCSCSFFNAFCFNNTKIGYSYNSSFLFKYDYNECISSINLDNICGNTNYFSDLNYKSFVNFFSFNNPEYLNNNNILCHYTFTNDNEKKKEDLILEIEVNVMNQKNMNNIDNGKHLMLIFVQEFDSLTKNLYEINLNEFEKKKYTIKIANYKYISIYLSLIKNSDYIEDNGMISMYLGAKKDNSNSEKMKKYKYSIIAICIIFIICAASCFILYFVKYKRNRELIRLRAITMANNLNEIVDPEEKKHKLEKLFQTKLKRKNYLKKYNINETTACSICLEEFVENTSLVSITPCLHIFHYKCLKNWLFSENSNCQCPYCNYDLLSNKKPTQRHKNQETNKIIEKQDKFENKNNDKENENKKEKEISLNKEENYESSARVIKKLKKNKSHNNNEKNDKNNINYINNNYKINNIENNNINSNNNNNINYKNNININNINNDSKNNKINYNIGNNIENYNIENNNSIENKNENIENKNENEENDISFENDFDKIKNKEKIIKNIKENIEINNMETNNIEKDNHIYNNNINKEQRSDSNNKKEEN